MLFIKDFLCQSEEKIQKGYLLQGWYQRWCGGRCFRALQLLAALLCCVTLAALLLPRQRPCFPPLQQWQPPPVATPPAPPSEPPLLDTDTRLISEDQLGAEIERRLPSLPYIYWKKHRRDKKKFYNTKTCAPFPSIYELHFHNTYWQTLHSSQGVFHFFGAYMDTRNASLIGHAVRVLGVHDRIRPSLKTHCQLWFEERAAPVLVPILEYKYVWCNRWGNYRNYELQPYLMACVLPQDVRHLVPASVSIVENECDRATNILRVHNDRPDPRVGRKEFAVCVKGLDFLHEDLSVRLVEWIEFLKIMGADKVFFYELQVHKNITKVLNYYKNQGTVTVTPISLPGGQPNIPGLQHKYLKKKNTHKRQMELIPYNDCLNRHMYEYRWLTLLDIDELIVPLVDANWSSLMKRILAVRLEPLTSFYVSNIYFLDSLRDEHGWEKSMPRYMHLLQQVYRTRNFTKDGSYVKAFHETDRVLTVHNHFAFACLGGCWSHSLEKQYVRLQHYKVDCMRAYKECREMRSEPVRDTTLWRWRDPLVARTQAVLRTLGFLPPDR
ncbi:uncharacterized protein LOC128679223 [Plodia interpunctella]|uniref:uncharacterized protein LOC128679223 n=1 Tax=Plodia interpunctella TaxID=58824 RepID=UPI00236840CC|nr:uncharacterized protein LOC128679223 [Plodia interpunctella]